MLKRSYSVPERICLFALGAAVVGSAYPTLMRFTPHGQGLPCPLRTLTGVPCPFCGLTTATVEFTHGQWATAASTNPLVYLTAVSVIATIPVLIARTFGSAAPPRPWSATAQRRTKWVMGFVVAASWLFQLHRFGFL